MKSIIMEVTLLLMFKSTEEINKFIADNKYQIKQTKLGINYLIK